jgi:hypothetical protein
MATKTETKRKLAKIRYSITNIASDGRRLNELEEELIKYPEKFTEDLKKLIKKYRKYLKPIK